MNRIQNARYVARCRTCGRAEGEWWVFPSNWTTLQREAWMSDQWTDLQNIASFALSERAMAIDLMLEEEKQADHWGDELQPTVDYQRRRKGPAKRVTPGTVDGDDPGRLHP